ncbi:hypothetical protein ACIQBJ_15260 [Kitasatospora sp. NPDC088391]|uniref:SCO2583/SCO2584 N-terminal domain-containing protein n=1 Tax=Kitasatospora sp. NPDC088391 TaxID=3364074 RepID=UPI00382F89ED
MSDHRQPDAIEPPDPFEGLVLDEEFVRSATVSEPSARARMLAERWRREPPVDPGDRRRPAEDPARARRTGRLRWPRPGRDRSDDGDYGAGVYRRPGLRGRFGVLSRGEQWSAVLGVLIVLLVVGGVLFGPNRAHTPQVAADSARVGAPRTAADRALSGGGVFAGSACGRHGYHRFPDAARPTGPEGGAGPAMVLGAYGHQRLDASLPGEFTFDLLLTGGSGPLTLAAPLGRDGVAVEIEGPDGVVAAAYGLPAEVSGASRLPDGGGWLVTGPTGASAHVVLPEAALCPGVDAQALTSGLMLPTDASRTITGPAPYTVTVSISDPEIAEARRTTHAQSSGQVLAATNQLSAATAQPV